MRILCVDDDQVARKIYEKGLAQEMPEDRILVFENAEIAKQVLSDEKVDVVITDMVMPGESGLELLRFVREESTSTEVILVTGHASIDTSVEAMRLGARDYIEKPIDISLLREKLENIREYQRRVSETEDYRLAKEAVEQHAAEGIALLEGRVEQMRQLILEARRITETDQSGTAEQRLEKLKEILQRLS